MANIPNIELVVGAVPQLMATLLSVLWFLASRWFLKTGMMLLLVTCFGAACSRILEQLAADTLGSSRFREIMFCVLLSGLLGFLQVFT